MHNDTCDTGLAFRLQLITSGLKVCFRCTKIIALSSQQQQYLAFIKYLHVSQYAKSFTQILSIHLHQPLGVCYYSPFPR